MIKQQFSILQWNTLADSLCTNDSFPKVPPQFLKWEHRQEQFQKILPQLNPDIFCFQEVDHFEFFKEILGNQYHYQYEKKPENPDGILIGVKKTKFDILYIKKTLYLSEKQVPSNQFFLHIKIKDLETQKILSIIGTHLKAKKQNENIRLLQVQQLLQYQESIDHQEITIFLGDFNTEPQSQSMKYFLQKIESQQYATVNTESIITTYKLREHEECRIIDYIYYPQKQLTHNGNAKIKSKEEIPYPALPSEIFPSDHQYLLASFLYKD